MMSSREKAARARLHLTKKISILVFAALSVFLISCPADLDPSLLYEKQDKLGPEIEITSPVDGTFYTKNVTVSGTVTDPSREAGDGLGLVGSMSFSVPRGEIQDAVTVEDDGTFTFTFSTEDISGEIEVDITAVDWNSNPTTVTISLLDDGTGPYLTIDSPADNSFYPSFFEVSGLVQNSSTDSGLEEVSWLNWAVPGSVLQGSVDISGMTAGDGYSFEVNAVDLAGNIAVLVTAGDYNGSTTTASITLLSAGYGIANVEVTPQNKAVDLVWDSVPFCDGYILRDFRNGFQTSIADPGDGTPIAYTYTGSSADPINNGQDLLLQIETVPNRQDKDPDYSEYMSPIPLSANTLVPRAYGDSGSIELEWNSISATDTFTILRSTARDDTGSYAVLRVVSGTSYTDTEVDEDTVYYYKLHPFGQEDIISDPAAGVVKNLPVFEPEKAGQFVTEEHGARSLAIIEDTLFLAIYDSGANPDYSLIECIDISNPEQPAFLASYGAPDLLPRDIGNKLLAYYDPPTSYIVAYFNGAVVILDVSDPADPVQVASYDYNPDTNEVRWISLAGSIVVVSADAINYDFIDLEAVPAPSARTSAGFTVDWRMATTDSYLFAGTESTEIEVWDITNPAVPVQETSITWTYDHTSPRPILDDSGTTLFSTGVNGGGDATLMVFDVTIPTSVPPPLNDTPDVLAVGIEISRASCAVGDEIAIPLNQGGIHVYDVGDPSTPFYKYAILTTTLDTKDLLIEGDYLFAADGWSGLYVAKLPPSSLPTEIYTDVYEWGNVICTTVSGDYAFYGTSDLALCVIDISDPGYTKQTYPLFFDQAGLVEGVLGNMAVSGNYLYTSQQDGVGITDISNPFSPVYKKYLDGIGGFFKIVVQGDYMYGTSTDQGLVIADIADPENPDVLSITVTQGMALGLDVISPYAYVTTISSGMNVYDISDPLNPFKLSSYSGAISGAAAGLDVSGRYTYLTNAVYGGASTLYVIGTADPADPVPVSSVILSSTDGSTGEVMAISDTLLCAAENGLFAQQFTTTNIHFINISDPDAPFVMHTATGSGYTSSIVTQGNYVYIADADSGFRIFDLTTTD